MEWLVIGIHDAIFNSVLQGQVIMYTSAFKFMRLAILTQKTYIQYVAEAKVSGKFVYSQAQFDQTNKAMKE